jgi:nitrate reductase NapA
MIQLERRDFLKMSAMAAAAAMIAPGAAAAEGAAPAGGDGLTWSKAPCRFCGTGCGVLLGAKDGKVVAMQADKEADVNKGLCCMKGYHVGLILYGQDRLTRPLKRVAEGKYEAISWDEALTIIAERIKAKPGKFALYGSGQHTIVEGYIANKFVKAGLGHNHIDPNARLCMASAAAGYNATYGVDEPTGCYDDLDHCTVLISWGNNPAEQHPVLFSRVMDRRLKGDKIHFIDLATRRTRSSEQADEVHFFNPQSDLAVANGIAHLLVKKGFIDKEWVQKHFNFRKRVAEYAKDPAKPVDFDPEAIKPQNLAGAPMTAADYAKAIEEYTPEHVEKISGVPADAIRRLADLFADPKQKVLSWWCMGPNQHTRGTAMNSLLHSIHHLAGQWGKPGCGSLSLTGQPSACGTAREVGTFAHLLPGHLPVLSDKYREIVEDYWSLPKGRISPKIGFHTVKMWEEFCKPDGAVDTIWVQVTNPGQTLPNQKKLFLKKKECPDKFLIVSDVYPTATTALADLILPSAMYVEKNGMYGNAERKTQQWFKMVPPPGEARDDAWQTLAVSRKLFELGLETMKDKDGEWIFAKTLKNADGSVPEAWKWENYYTINVDERCFEEFRRFTRLKHKDLAPYQVYVKAHGLRWPVVQQPDGTWKETLWRFVEGKDPYVKPGAGWQFYHSNSKDDRAFIWFHQYEQPPEMPDAAYPFWLCTGRVIEHWHSGTMTMRVPPLRRSMPHAYVEVHPDDAAALGVVSGDQVVVESRRGELKLPVWINGRGKPPKGTVFVPFFDERLQINLVTLDAHDPFSKQPDFKKCAVRLRRA